jgi:hypothetical protein
LVINMNFRSFASSIRPPKAPRHEAGSTPRHSIPCRYFARGYCSRGDSCMFSHSFYDPTQPQGLQGNHLPIVPFWSTYTPFSPQPPAKRPYVTRRPSLNPEPIIVPPRSPSSSSVTTPDETSPIFSSRLPEGSSPTPPMTISDIAQANSTRTSITANGDTSCDEFSTTRSDAAQDEFLPSSADVHFAEFYSLSPHPPTHLTPVPYVQRGFGYRDNRARGRENRRRRTKVKLISAPRTNQQRETSGSPAPVVLQGAAPRKPSIISDSDSACMKPHQETWRVIGGGVMLGTATNTTSRRKLKRLESYIRAEELLNASYDESPDFNRSTDESFEFSNLVASVKLTINRPPLPDIIERPKSSLPPAKVSPLTAFFTHAEVA